MTVAQSPSPAPCDSEISIHNLDHAQSGAGDSLPVPQTHQSGIQLSIRIRTIKLSYFNALQPGPEIPIAPGRGENWPFGERFGRSFRSRSPECTGQPHGKLGVFRAVSPAESGSPLGWWRSGRSRGATFSEARWRSWNIRSKQLVVSLRAWGLGTLQALREAPYEIYQTYNTSWRIERHGFKLPNTISQQRLPTAALAA
jgi:hypothetical protein